MSFIKKGELDSFPHDAWDALIYGPIVLLDTDGITYRMFYTGYTADNSTHHPCMATSTDLVNWTKPNVGLVTYDGSTNNNIIFTLPGDLTNLTGIIYAEGRYLAAAFDANAAARGSFLYESANGQDFVYSSNMFAPLDHGFYLEAKGLQFTGGKYKCYYSQGHTADTRSIGCYEFYPYNQAQASRTDLGLYADFTSTGGTLQYYDMMTWEQGGKLWGAIPIYNNVLDELGPIELWSSVSYGLNTVAGSWVKEHILIPKGAVGDWDEKMVTVGKPILMPGGEEWLLMYSGSSGLHDAFPNRTQDLGFAVGNIQEHLQELLTYTMLNRGNLDKVNSMFRDLYTLTGGTELARKFLEYATLNKGNMVKINGMFDELYLSVPGGGVSKEEIRNSTLNKGNLDKMNAMFAELYAGN
jgi:hypothetical protein